MRHLILIVFVISVLSYVISDDCACEFNFKAGEVTLTSTKTDDDFECNCEISTTFKPFKMRVLDRYCGICMEKTNSYKARLFALDGDNRCNLQYRYMN